MSRAARPRDARVACLDNHAAAARLRTFAAADHHGAARLCRASPAGDELIAPPAPLVPLPTLSTTPPPRPAVLAPLPTQMAPELPPLLDPELNTSRPLVPAPPRVCRRHADGPLLVGLLAAITGSARCRPPDGRRRREAQWHLVRRNQWKYAPLPPCTSTPSASSAARPDDRCEAARACCCCLRVKAQSPARRLTYPIAAIAGEPASRWTRYSPRSPSRS